MLTKNEFEVLCAIQENHNVNQQSLSRITQLSLDLVKSIILSLEECGFVFQNTVTTAGLKELDSYRVDNAIIMAAGLSSRFAPISYSKPKGLLRVYGDVLIERQIRQLQEAGVHDIIVVVGYKKEDFFYLEEEFGVTLVVNDEYATRNNHSTLMAVANNLRNSYICSSDNYFSENPFKPYVYKAYYAAQMCDGPTEEWCIKTDPTNRIVDVEVGGSDSLIMIGHAYFDEAFSKTFVSILEEEYQLPCTVNKLWEELYREHVAELDMVAQEYPRGVVHEFDTLDELREFDPKFLDNVDSEAYDNICSALSCSKDEICDVYPLNQGLTNLSCHIRVGNSEYVYRHPGIGTEDIIDRNAEVRAQQMAYELGLDTTFITEDPIKGWKLSRFIPHCRTLDPSNPEQVARAMRMARQLHEADVSLERSFDFYQESRRYEELLLRRIGRIEVADYEEMASQAKELKRFADADNMRICLTHNDFFMLNFLLDENDELSLIDWEYSGMADYASDFGTFVVCCQLSEDQAKEALASYFGRTPTQAELRHNFAYVALAGWCWYLWALLKEAEGDIVGEWLDVYYRYAKEYLKSTLEAYCVNHQQV